MTEDRRLRTDNSSLAKTSRQSLNGRESWVMSRRSSVISHQFQPTTIGVSHLRWSYCRRSAAGVRPRNRLTTRVMWL